MNDPHTFIARMENVSKSYRSGEVQRTVFAGANLKVCAGDLIVVYGPSRCGKTTLLNLIGALDKATSGDVWIEGINLSKADPRHLADIRRKKIGCVFQYGNLISNLTALENVEVALEAVGMRGAVVRERAMNSLSRVGLTEETEQFPEQLSGVKRQRVAIARALAKDPALVLADEPTGNLDEQDSIKIAELMTRLHRDLGTTFIVATHNQTLAQMASHVYYISRGRLMGA